MKKINSNKILGITILAVLIVGPIVGFAFHLALVLVIAIMIFATAIVQVWAKYYETKRSDQLKKKAEQDYIDLKLQEIEEKSGQEKDQ